MERIMSQRKVWTVEPRDDGRWAVQREGAIRADTLHETKQSAVDRGVDLGTRARGQVRIKGEDGRIQDERTYTRDPYPPKG
jgi:hypothetical protein